MIKFNKYTLSNGLKLIHHYDSATKMVALNLLYNVGSKDEDVTRTGLAHLMEHLMFSGSANVPGYDDVLQAAGGMSNAWTNNDMTNYYETLPACNIETGLWAESDRLMSLNLNSKSIQTQKDVVVEEFKQRYLNEPYGDISHLMHDLAYTQHPYKWPTIGIETSHIQNATDKDIINFYHHYYSVNNLIMCISGNVTFDEAIKLTEKWFGDIKPIEKHQRSYLPEPKQDSHRVLHVTRDVPQSMIYKAFHMPGRNDAGYPACDLISDILSNGKSSRFYQNVMSQSAIFTELDAAIEGAIEPGLFLLRARLNDGVSFEQAEEIINNELNKLVTDKVDSFELEKCKNKFHAAMLFDNIGYQEKAQKLCEYELLGDAGLINEEVARYRKTTADDIKRAAEELFDVNNTSTIYYKANN